MKRFFYFILVLVTVLALAGCGASAAETEPSMFVEVESATHWDVVYHRDTKVMYVVSDGTYNRGTFTLLVDADGKPMLWEG